MMIVLVKTHDTSMHIQKDTRGQYHLKKLIWCQLHNYLFLVCISNDDVDMSTITTRASCVPPDTGKTQTNTTPMTWLSRNPKHTHKWTEKNGKWELTHNHSLLSEWEWQFEWRCGTHISQHVCRWMKRRNVPVLLLLSLIMLLNNG